MRASRACYCGDASLLLLADPYMIVLLLANALNMLLVTMQRDINLLPDMQFNFTNQTMFG